MFLKRLFWWAYKWSLCWIPIRADEHVLRLITKDWYKPGKPVPFGRVAFEPNKENTDGISLYRERWVNPRSLDASARKSGTYYVVRLRVKDILELHLTLKPTVGKLPGHVVIPQLSKNGWADSKTQLAPLVAKLAELAGKGIILTPSTTTTA